jgi:putative GTP pyrophosphokinase
MPIERDLNGSILANYEQQATDYDQFRCTCEALLAQLLRMEGFRVHSVTSRLKNRKSLAAKLEREGKKYSKLSQVTDVVGLRVITHFEDEVDRIGSLIEREFSVDYENSTDKRKVLDPDKFGYLSLHYICSLTAARLKLAEHRRCKGLVCEIQVRSILQHAWAEIEHDLGYKAGASLPPHIRRRFSRLAGLLEVADAEFSQLRNDIHNYSLKIASDLKQHKTRVAIDPISLRTFIKTDLTLRSLDNILANFGYRLRGTIETIGTVEELRHVGITDLDQLRKELSRYRQPLQLFWRRMVSFEAGHTHLPHGITLWHFFQLAAAADENLAKTRKTLNLFNVGSPTLRLDLAKRLIKIVSEAKSSSKRKAKNGRRPIGDDGTFPDPGIA